MVVYRVARVPAPHQCRLKHAQRDKRIGRPRNPAYGRFRDPPPELEAQTAVHVSSVHYSSITNYPAHLSLSLAGPWFATNTLLASFSFRPHMTPKTKYDGDTDIS